MKGSIDENGFIYCPVCENKTRVKVLETTYLEFFPLFCHKCKKETIIHIKNLNIVLEPDARRRADNI